jgi:hypothetical protein
MELTSSDSRNNNHFLRLDTVARQIDVEPTIIKEWGEAGEFPLYRFPNNEVRVVKQDIDTWIASKRIVAGTAASAAAAVTVVRPKNKRRTGQAKAIGYRLHMLRTLNGLSQSFCADALKFEHWKELDGFERGYNIFDQALIETIANYFSVRSDWLAAGTGSMNDNNVSWFMIGHRPIKSQHIHNYKKALRVYLPQLAKDYAEAYSFTIPNAVFMTKSAPGNIAPIWKAPVMSVLLLATQTHGYLAIITDQTKITTVISNVLEVLKDIKQYNKGQLKMTEIPPCLVNRSGNENIVSALDSFCREQLQKSISLCRQG